MASRSDVVGDEHVTKRQCMRTLIADDAHAGTFQSLGQYRAALLQYIDNLEAAEQAALQNATWE